MKRGANDVSDRSRGFVMVWLKRAAVVVAVMVGAGAGPAGAEVQWVHTDAIGNVRALTDQFGTVIERHDLLPFGEEPGAAPGTQAKRFTGKERDVETGLDYFGARYYRANTGRFTTVDPVMTIQANLVDPQRWNRYAYAKNNPLRYKDPDGRVIETVADIAFIAYDLIDIGVSAVTGQGVTGIQWAALGADVAGAAIPFATGGGIAVRAAAKVDDAVDGARGLAGHGADAGRTFDQARREAFERAGMTDPSQVKFTKVDPKTGTVVEFKGPGGAKVAYDGPHPNTPGPHHDTQHVGWQTGGKRGQGGTQRGNIPYSGPQHPSRSPVKGAGDVDPH